MTPEELASGKFTLAMLLAEAGKTDTAEEYCQFIVKTYPGTPGAAQAQAYLEKPFDQ
jgi:TolA-binding protein